MFHTVIPGALTCQSSRPVRLPVIGRAPYVLTMGGHDYF